MNLAAKCFSQSSHRGPAEINSGGALTREMQCKQAEPEIKYMDEDLPGFLCLVSEPSAFPVQGANLRQYIDQLPSCFSKSAPLPHGLGYLWP